MTVPYTFANAAGLVPASELDVNFAYVSNNVSTANTVVSNAQPNITSVGTLTNLSVAGNITTGHLIGEGGNISNVRGANVSGAVANATYAVTANSATYATYTFSSNATQANIANIANLVTGGNVSGQVANALIAGTVYTNAQPNITSVGTLSSLSSSGNVTGGNILTSNTVSAVGNVRGGNFNTVGLVTATGNVTGGNILTNGEVSAAGNVTGGNISTSANMLASGYISATGNIDTGGLISAVGNISTSTNVLASGRVDSTGNVRGGNINTVGNVSATGNVTSANLNVGSGNVNVGNVVFALDGSKFNSAKWTLVETINADLTFGDQVVATTNSYSYYASNYNEVLYLCGAGGNGGTITIPVSAVSNNSQWRVNDAVGIKWANIANANITVVDLQNPLTTVTVTMYAR
jgi:hypothetical protein